MFLRDEFYVFALTSLSNVVVFLTSSQDFCADCEIEDDIAATLVESKDLVIRDVRETFDEECHYPCNTSCMNVDIQCKGGVSRIRDGCNCCYMCARQQGDLCSLKDKCDENKGFYCDLTVNVGSIQMGVCKAKSARSCTFNTELYRDGQEETVNCSRCSCQDGQFTCVSLCPQEERAPSRLHCGEPVLMHLTSDCCKDWVCPHAHSRALPEDFAREHNQVTCRSKSTDWSSCSVTCGMGVSKRITNDNKDCHPIQEERLCIVRPCELDDSHITGRHCKNTMREESVLLRFGNCHSVKEFRPKYCSTCKRNRCCYPDLAETRDLEFRCDGDEIVVRSFMWVKSCRCDEECHPPVNDQSDDSQLSSTL